MGNLGDDFMLDGFLTALKGHLAGLRLTCCSMGDLALLSRRHPQIEWLPCSIHHRLRALSSADCWLGLGGTPFQTDSGDWFERHLDEERVMCRGAGLPMYFLGVGVGNANALERPAFRRIARAATHVWARDALSRDHLSRVIPGRVTEAADLANILFRDLPPQAQVPGVGLLLHFERPGVVTAERLEACMGSLPGVPFSWLVQEQRDLAGSEKALWQQLPETLRARLPQGWNMPEKVISSRYHGALLAAWRGCGLLILARNEKLVGLAEALGLPARDAASDWHLMTDMRSVDRGVLRTLADRAESSVAAWLGQVNVSPPRPVMRFRTVVRNVVYRTLLGTFRLLPSLRPRRHFRLAILKLDKIGDAVLALSAMRRLMRRDGEADTLLIVSAMAEPLLRQEFPHASFFVLPAFCQRLLPDLVVALARHAAALSAISADTLVCLRHQPSDYLHCVASLIHAKQIFATRWDAAHENTSLDFPRCDRVPYPSPTACMVGKASLSQELRAHRDLLSAALKAHIGDDDILPALETVPTHEGDCLFVCPAAGSPLREYPANLLADALRLFRAECPAVPVRICLPPGTDRTALEQALRDADLTGLGWVFPHDLAALVAEVAAAGVVLAPESATAHIATALDKPGVFLLGGGHHGLLAPWARSGRQRWLSQSIPCYHCGWRCVHAVPRCLTHVTPQEIVQALGDSLGLRAGPL